MPKLGAVHLDVVYGDSPRRSVKITDHPLESGESTSDHIRANPFTMNISGIITGGDASVRIKRLEAYLEKGTILTYSHRASAVGVVIERFDSEHTADVGNGFTFTMTLKRIRMSKATLTEYMDLPVKAKTSSVTNKGVQQTQKPKDIKDKNNKDQKKKSSLTASGLTPAQEAARNGNRIKTRP